MARMNARYAGKCAECGGYFPAGTEIEYSRETRKAAHVACPEVPAKAPAAPVEKMVSADALRALAEKLENEADELLELAFPVERDVREKALASFVARGGCRNCNGTGTVTVHWMDGGVDYMDCADCHKDPAVKAKAEEVGHYSVTEEAARIGMADALLEAQENIGEARAMKEEVRAIREILRVSKGCEVEVVKGRKVAKGTKGKVFWYGESSFGFRVGIKDAEGNTHWTTATNVKVIAVPEFEVKAADFKVPTEMVAAA